MTIVERAVAPAAPRYPDKRQFSLSGLVFGLLIGLVLVVGLDVWHDTVKTADELEQLQLDPLAVVPRHSGAEHPVVTEAYQNIRTALLFNRAEEGGQVVLVTSSTPQEGKTSTTIQLAHLLAAAGESTVMVDCDLRRGQLHSRLTLEREPGLTDVLAHQRELEAAVRPVGPNLWAVTTGPPPPNPPALLARKQTMGLLQELRKRFEWVIVDSPPLASVTDAQLLARYADACVFVVRYDRASKAIVRRSVRALRKSGGNLLGAVLNAVETRTRGYEYQYDYYYREPGGKAVESGTLARWVGLLRGSKG